MTAELIERPLDGDPRTQDTVTAAAQLPYVRIVDHIYRDAA